MVRRISRSILIAVILVAGCSKKPDLPSAAVRLNVGAAASLKEVVGEGRSAYAKEVPAIEIVARFEASSAIVRQIEAGGATDLFLSADKANADRVQAKAKGAPVRFLANRLVVVGKADLALGIASPDDLAKVGGKIAIAGAAVPAGKYARDFIERIGFRDRWKSQLVIAEDVRGALELVDSGAADIGFVYATDAKVAKKARLLWTIPDSFALDVAYYAVVLQGPNESAAAAFVEWLRSDAFLRLAEARGFVRVP